MLETTILAHLIYTEEYGKAVLPFLNSEYFHENGTKKLFGLIKAHSIEYNKFPSKEELYITIENITDLNQSQFDELKSIVVGLTVDEKTSVDWLIDQTEKFCQDRAVYNAIRESIKIIDDRDSSEKGSIPKLLQDALQVSFDTHIGHDYIDDSDKRHAYYTASISKIPFDLDYFNKITNGGLPSKTLSVFVAGVNVGKTQLMCHCAGNNLRDGYNVLYITMEMSQEEISKRVDANLLDIPMDELSKISKYEYDKKMERIKRTTKGKLIVKEYPTAQAHTGHFRHLLNELKLKKNFVPQIVYIDYINICASSRIKRGNSNSYEYIKAIAEEIRGLAVECDIPIVTATQLTRSGYSSSDIGLEDTAESFGLPATADFMLGMVSTEELDKLSQIMCKQLKNRLGNKQNNKKFLIGVDRQKMRFYDVDQSAQEDLLDGPVMDETKFGSEDKERSKPKLKFDKSKFHGFK